jgi:hypothetical protein
VSLLRLVSLPRGWLLEIAIGEGASVGSSWRKSLVALLLTAGRRILASAVNKLVAAWATVRIGCGAPQNARAETWNVIFEAEGPAIQCLGLIKTIVDTVRCSTPPAEPVAPSQLLDIE